MLLLTNEADNLTGWRFPIERDVQFRYTNGNRADTGISRLFKKEYTMRSYSFGDFLLMSVPLLVIAGALVAVIVVYGRSIFRWFHDNAQPLLTVKVKVISKREELRRSMQSDIVEVLHPFKSHYVTFELENGKQIEFLVPPAQVGRMEEDKLGLLTYQGSRFKGFMG